MNELGVIQSQGHFSFPFLTSILLFVLGLPALFSLETDSSSPVFQPFAANM